MKRLFLLTVFLLAGVVAQAAPRVVMTLDEFLAKKKGEAEQRGNVFDEAKAKKQFDAKDLDKDGKLSIEEQTPPLKANKAPTK
jgi:hypothetical protein